MNKNRSEELCREFRGGMTASEARLWRHIRDRQLDGMKFRRQHPFGGIVADFYCFEKALVIEVDGEVHQDPEQRERDEQRDRELASRGLTVLRFTNEQVDRNLDAVLQIIRSVDGPALEAPAFKSSPSPSRMERGDRRSG